MNQTLLEAKTLLETDGLTVNLTGDASLYITATSEEVGGIKFSQDASVLIKRNNHWIAIFPGPGISSYEVTGSLEYLVALIRGVYIHYRSFGGSLKDAFERTVPNSASYLVGLFEF